MKKKEDVFDFEAFSRDAITGMYYGLITTVKEWTV